MTVAGLPANAGGYHLYVYADGDNPGATRTGGYKISGTGITTTSVNLIDEEGAYFSGTFTQANNSAGTMCCSPSRPRGSRLPPHPGHRPIRFHEHQSMPSRLCPWRRQRHLQSDGGAEYAVGDRRERDELHGQRCGGRRL